MTQYGARRKSGDSVPGGFGMGGQQDRGARRERSEQWPIIEALNGERSSWFSWAPVLIGFGTALYFQLADEPSLWLCALIAVAMGFAVWLGARRPGWYLAASLLLLVAVGFGAAKLRTEWVRAPFLERSLGVVDIKGIVERIEARPNSSARLTLRPLAIEKLQPERLPFRVRIRARTAGMVLAPGDVIRVRARLAPPPPPALPGGFDFARHAWFQGIGAVGYSLAAPELVNEAIAVPASLKFAAAIEQVRQTIAARMRAILPDQSGAIAIALVTGERGGISETTNEIYRDAGLFHILSISGMHMAIMAGAVFFVIRLLLAAIPAIALRYPIKKWAAVLAAIAALGYLALSGGAFATVRSYIMISVMFFAVLVDRPALALRNVALAALIILLVFPESIHDPGFQMSFAAVAALISAYEIIRNSSWGGAIAEFGPVRKAIAFVAGIVVSTLVAGLAVAPFAAYHFHTTQHLAVLANLIAMPVSNIVIMPAALGVLILMPFGLEWPAVTAMGLGIDVMTQTAQWVAGLPGAVGHVATMPGAAFGLMVFGGLWLVLWQARWRFGGVALIAAGVALVPFGARPDILVGNKGRDVVVRGADGLLHQVKAKRRVSFGVARWLEADGQDTRRSRGANAVRTPAAPVANCDAFGCLAKVKSLSVAVAFHAGALRDDCRDADVVVFVDPVPDGCGGPSQVIDFFDIYYGGTHAVYVDGSNAVRVESVAARRGTRPWTRALPGREAAKARHKARAQNREADKANAPAESSTVSRGGDGAEKRAAPTFYDSDGDAASDAAGNESEFGAAGD